MEARVQSKSRYLGKEGDARKKREREKAYYQQNKEKRLLKLKNGEKNCREINLATHATHC